jgi:Ceramidase
MNASHRIVWALFLSLPILILAVFNFVPPIPQNLHYHQFADQRSFFGIPNALNVLSNLPFLIVGMLGFVHWSHFYRSSKNNEKGVIAIYTLIFSGLFLTGLGSAYYHWQPDNARLVWDRLPMTLVFMPLLAVSIAEKIDQKAGLYSLFPLVFLGIGSVGYWHWTEQQGQSDLRLYGIVQFYPMLAIPLIILLFPSKMAFTKAFLGVAFFYLLAKITEYADLAFLQIGQLMSGHSLKHLLAAGAGYFIVRAFLAERK